MRLRVALTATLLLSCVLSSAPAWASSRLHAPGSTVLQPSLRPQSQALLSRPNIPPRNLDVERAQLRALIRQRHALLERFAPEDAQRSQLLTLSMLSAADAVLAGDAAALDARIKALREAAARRAALQRRQAHETQEAWLIQAAPGTLWSPLARGASAGPLAWARPVAPAGAAHAALAPPLVMSLTALTSWEGLLPTPTPTPPAVTPTVPAAPRTPSATVGPPRPASIGDPAFVAPSHGGLLVDGGSGGAVPPDAANPGVAAAILTPIPTVAAQRRAAQPHPRPATLTLADLTQRRRAVAAALEQVRALEDWTTAHPPSTLTPNDIILSPQMLGERIDHWGLTLPVTSTLPSGAAPRVETQPRAPSAIVGATLALSSTAAGQGANGLALEARLAGDGTRGRVDSTLADPALLDSTRSVITAPVSLTASLPISLSSPITPDVAASATATSTVDTSTPLADGSLVTITPSAVAGLASATATVPITVGTATPAAGQQEDAISTTAAITAQAAISVSVETSTPTLTVTDNLSATAPLTLVVTLPATDTAALTPPGFAGDRGTLESVLRQGSALFAHLQDAEAGAMQQYHAQLSATVRLNTALEQRWYAHVYAYNGYVSGLAAYHKRVAAYNAYAHRVHLAQLRHQKWVEESAAWTDYARKLAAYKVAMASRRAPIAPISGTVPATETAPLPTPPVMPPFPGPEPPPFTEEPPAWPGQPPPAVAPAGLEPSGYALPVPPEGVPPWDGDSPIISVVSYGGISTGVIAVGREETTQAALLADGALDGVPAYQDPIKGIITTYWGGQTVFQSFHPGVDIAAPMYTPIHAAAAGLVTYAGYAVPGQRHDSYGLCVVIKHNDHFSTLYAHMDDLKYGLQVHSGDVVQAGQVIGYVGLTGWTTGPHLHFEMRDNNVQFNPLLLIPNPQD